MKTRSIFQSIIVAGAVLGLAVSAGAQQPADDYVVGPLDILTISLYDQPELSGRFVVETDGTFTYPLTGRVRAGGLTLRTIEMQLARELIAGGFFLDPQVAVAIVQYNSQKFFIVGEVAHPGAYPLSSDMTLIEALALAGSPLPTASGEVVIARTANGGPQDAEHFNVRDAESGDLSRVHLRSGNTIFVLKAQHVFVFGQVKNPGAYPVPPKTMVLQALSVAGGLTDRGAAGRITVLRTTADKNKEVKISLTDYVEPGDTIVVPERYF